MEKDKFDSNLMLRNEMGVVNNIYFDMACFQDFKIGSVINMITTMTEYQYMLAKINDYNEAYDDSIEKNFPILKIKDSDIDDHMQNPENHNTLSKISPMTSLFNDIPLYLKTIQTLNSRFDKEEKINLQVNTYPIKYAPEAKKKFISYVKDCNIKCTVTFMCEKLNTLPYTFFIPLENLIIFDIEEFLDINYNVAKYFCEDGLFVPKNIIAVAKINYKYIKDKAYSESESELLMNTQSTLNHCTTFNFCRRRILIEQPSS